MNDTAVSAARQGMGFGLCTYEPVGGGQQACPLGCGVVALCGSK